MSLSLVLLGSGSSGNATLVSDGDTHILVDVGLSGKETERRLAECGLTPQQISAIVVSHEHGDHCRGIGPFAKHLKVPVFITDGAYAASGLVIDESRRQRIESGRAFDVHGVVFTPFAVPHDAADPIAFRIEKSGVRIAIVLDLGYVSNLVAERLKGCDGIVLESNHDIRMLKVGPYPWALKQRVMSRRGHLSNDGVSEYLTNGFDGKASHLVLAHLSEKNNLPDLAMLSAQRALEERSSLVSLQTRLDVARPDRVSARYRF
ncbi:MAG: beta-lactamase-like protein [Acidobacteria bacterium]|nr:beta-lactamase-like protein [Acidobacteriota bacterium]